MNIKLLLALITAVFMLSFVLAGCSSSGVSQELYDQQAAQLKDCQSKYAEFEKEKADLQTEKATVDVQLKDCQVEVEEKESQIDALKAQYEITGATPAETAGKIVKYYHDTHEYSMIDLFICSDMAGEVWNMLKAQGITARIAVGNIDATISDILQCDHAWVLAEVAPGEYLALEATGGRVVLKSENALYYNGWYFDSPADLKSYNNMLREYNILIGVRNQINDAATEAINMHNSNLTNPTEADKWKTVYDKIVLLRTTQEDRLNELMSEVTKLAKRL